MQADAARAVDADPLDQLRRLIARNRLPPQVALVAGGRGTGRSTLLRRLAEESDLEALWIGCAEFAASEPLRSLREAMAAEQDPVFPGHSPFMPRVGKRPPSHPNQATFHAPSRKTTTQLRHAAPPTQWAV